MNAMRNTSTPKSSSTLLRQRAAAIAAAVICVAAGASRIGQPSFAITNGGSITALDVPLTEDFDTLASTGTGIAWTRQFDDSRLVVDPDDLQLGHRVVEHRRPLQLRRGRNEPVTDRALGSVASGGDRDRLPGGQADEQHRRDDYVARHQLRRRAVAQRRQHDRPHSHLSIPGRQRRRHHRRQCSGDRLDDVSRVELHEPCHRRDSRRARRQRRGEPHRQVSHAPGDGHRRPGDLVAVAGSGRRWERSRPGDRRFLGDGEGGAAGDDAPSVVSTTPANPATNVAVNSTIVINFSESVTRPPARSRSSARQAPRRRLRRRASPASYLHADSCFADLPSSTTCTVTVSGRSDLGYRHERSARLDGIGLHLLVHDGRPAAARCRRTSSSTSWTADTPGHRRGGVRRALRWRRRQHAARRPGRRLLQRHPTTSRMRRSISTGSGRTRTATSRSATPAFRASI